MTMPAAKGLVLVVEDDADLRDTVVELLQLEGYRTAAAGNGQEALDYLSHAPPPCLILLDLLMPVVNGWEFRRRQRQSPPLDQIPVAVVSAFADDASAKVSLDPVAWIKKPAEWDQLLGVIREHCG